VERLTRTPPFLSEKGNIIVKSLKNQPRLDLLKWIPFQVG
jgi:hypothetical protein